MSTASPIFVTLRPRLPNRDASRYAWYHWNFRNLSSAVSLLSVLALTCCRTEFRYLVKESVIGSPTVTVIPYSSSDEDAAAADVVSGYILSYGVTLVERPALVKEKSDYEGRATGTGIGMTSSGQLAVLGSEGGQKGKLTISVDPVALMAECKTDYVLFVSAKPWIRLVNRSTGQVLYSGSITEESQAKGCCLSHQFYVAPRSDREVLREILGKAGIITSSTPR